MKLTQSLIKGVVLSMTLLSASWCQAEITVENAWVRLLPPGVMTTAAYMELSSTETDTLLRASAEIAATVELHQSTMENGMMSMTHLPSLDVMPDERVSFTPQGKHLMVMGLKRGLKAGEQISIVLEFEKAGKLSVPFTVSK